MPGGDRTGPMGEGPMTGRAAGFCAGFGLPGYANPAFGRGFGRGFGGGFRGRGAGRGWRNMYYATGLTGWQRGAFAAGPGPWPGAPKREDELAALKSQAGQLGGALDAIRRRIDELEGEPEKE